MTQCNTSSFNVRVLGSLVATVLCASGAIASITDPVLRVEVSNSIGTGSLTYNIADGTSDPDGSFFLDVLAATQITNGSGDVIATLQNANVFTLDAPQSVRQISTGFSLLAGDAAGLTTVTITTTLLSFSGITNPSGFAGGSLGVTDSSPFPGNGATLTGLQPGGGAFLTQYNGYVPGGTTFASQVASVVAPPNGSNSAPMNQGFDPILGIVSNMSAQYKFTLTANDTATSTSNWVITPEPSAFALLGLGAMAVSRRVRR